MSLCEGRTDYFVFPQNGLQFRETAPVGKKVENDVHQINLYPLDDAILVFLILIPRIEIHPMNSASFEQLWPG